jgi:hypothetical protein
MNPAWPGCVRRVVFVYHRLLTWASLANSITRIVVQPVLWRLVRLSA